MPPLCPVALNGIAVRPRIPAAGPLPKPLPCWENFNAVRFVRFFFVICPMLVRASASRVEPSTKLRDVATGTMADYARSPCLPWIMRAKPAYTAHASGIATMNTG